MVAALVETPFHTRVSDQCGPSALATVLQASGITVAPEALKSRVYIPDREGSLPIEMLAATRGYKRIPYLINPDITALLGELQAGRPVLVLQNLGRSFCSHLALRGGGWVFAGRAAFCTSLR